MKVVSWNIGNFIWAKYIPSRKHYAFHKEDIHAVCERIKNENADVVFLQEIQADDIDFIKGHFDEFPFSHVIQMKEETAASLFMSKHEVHDLIHSESHDYVINGFTFFPIHLYAFSPRTRKRQVEELLPDLPFKKAIILGDTNFWIFQNIFISRLDKASHRTITKKYTDILDHLGSTCRIFLSLDKIFITKDLRAKEQKIIKHTINHIDHYMISSVIESDE